MPTPLPPNTVRFLFSQGYSFKPHPTEDAWIIVGSPPRNGAAIFTGALIDHLTKFPEIAEEANHE